MDYQVRVLSPIVWHRFPSGDNFRYARLAVGCRRIGVLNEDDYLSMRKSLYGCDR
jgi:hypothetical protein